MFKQNILIVCFMLSLSACVQVQSPEELAKKADYASKKAEQSYRDMILTEPDLVKHKVSLADFYFKQKRYSEAENVLSGIKTDEARLLIAKVYAHQMKYTKALEVFERVADLKDLEARWLYAQCLERKNLFPQAKKIYEELKVTDYAEKAIKRLKELQSYKSTLSPELKVYIDKPVLQEDFPDSDSVLIFSKEMIELKDDNTSVYTIHALVKVLNDRGRDRWAELNLNYDSTYQRVELEYARTITPDHELVSVGKENLRDVSRYMNFPLYSNSRAYIISMPQVSKGSYIEYKAKIYRSKLVNEDDMSVIYRLFEGFPVLESELTFRLPKNREALFAVLNKKYLPKNIVQDPDIIEKDQHKDYIYKFNNIPRLLPESHMVNNSKVNPAIVFSTFNSWEEFYAWWYDLYKDKLTMNKEMSDFLDTLVGHIEDDHEKARLIYEFCARRIRYVAIEYGDAGFEPHAAQEVFFNRYGDCKDQAILLVTLLREAGLKAYPVLIPTEEVYDLREDIVASYFNHAIAAVELDGELIFMDPTSSTTSFGSLPLGDQDRNVLVFDDQDYQIKRIPQQSNNELLVQMQIIIGEDEKATIKRRLEYKGFYASSYRGYYKETPPSLIQDTVLRKARSMSSLAKLEEMKISNVEDFTKNPVLEYSFSAPNFLSNAQDLRIVPVLSEDLLDASFIDKDSRKFPLDMQALYTIRTEIALILPDNLEVVYLPDNLSIDTKWGSLNVSLDKVYNTIHFKEIFNVNNRVVEVEEYGGFKKSLEDILYKSKKQLILRTKKSL